MRSIMAGAGDYGGDHYVPRNIPEVGVITPPMDSSFSRWPAVPVLGVIASSRQLLYAKRRGDRLSDRMSASVFLAYFVSAALDLARFLLGVA